MGKLSSNVSVVLGRCLKALVVAVLLPLPIGMLGGIVTQLEVLSVSGGTFREWVGWGFMTYVGFHVLLYRPVPLFRVSHRVFSTLAVWLFGGQVSSVESAGAAKGKGGKAPKGDAAARGSTLVAFSPYVVPVYTVVVCGLGWVGRQWWDRAVVDGQVGFLIGVTIAFHWLMTADDLQQQRSRWHLETYLLAISLVFMLTLVVGVFCLPLAVPEFQVGRALADGLLQARAIYSTVIQQLFW